RTCRGAVLDGQIRHRDGGHGTEAPGKANDAPEDTPLGLRPNIIRIRSSGGPAVTRHWGMPSPAALVLAILTTSAVTSADPAAFVPTQTVPDPPPRSPPGPPRVLRPTWDLDGLYIWLGPVAAVGRQAVVDREGTLWDS